MRSLLITSLIVLLGAGAIVTLGAEMQAKKPAAVVVTVRHPNLVIQVLEPSSLRAVFDALCQETQAQCEGLELAEDVPLAPMTLTGTWRQVAASLLEGTPINYVSRAATARQPAYLLLQARSAIAEQPAREPSRRPVEIAGDGSRPALDADVEVQIRKWEEERKWEREVEGNETGAGSSPTAGGGFGGDGRGSSGGAALPSFMGGPSNTTPYAGPRYSPFPDSNGNPVLLNPNAPANISPFPDSRGMPILLRPLPPGQRMGSPFPPSAPSPAP